MTLSSEIENDNEFTHPYQEAKDKGRTQGQTTKELLSQNLDYCVFLRV